ncbi:uncharacterized protein LOC125056052 [Pieris napi]|uniref:uncharacterized protein LOC125056052 n=1 Tax=Pieris napi TaxID=78633 RepID=UPI001FBBE6CD|nr:uncharacterized protein LOC125056052 [Pieris napi]
MNCIRLLGICRNQTKLKISYACYSAQHPLRFLETQDRWRDKDGLSRNWNLIYKAPLDKSINWASTFLTFSSSSIAAATIYYSAFLFDINTINDPVVVGDDVVLANNATECLVYLASFFVFHIAVKVLISKYVLRMYQDGDNYLAVFRGHWYNSIYKHPFHLNEFKKLKPTLVVSWGDARYSLGKKHGIILDNYFKTPEHYNSLVDKKKYENSE